MLEQIDEQLHRKGALQEARAECCHSNVRSVDHGQVQDRHLARLLGVGISEVSQSGNTR